MKFLSMFGGISDKYEKNGNHLLKFMTCGRQGLTFISTNPFSLYWIQ
jgi:hypothetical protein